MAEQNFIIEFKYPRNPGASWVNVRARVEEADTGVFRVYQFQTGDKLTKFPIEEIFLERGEHGWVQQGEAQESLLSAMIGQVIAGRKRGA